MTNKSDFCSRSIEKVKRLWHLYILCENPEHLKEAIERFPDNFLMIGTGSHEMYQTKNEFLSGMSEDQIESRGIKFELPDEWYEAQSITDDVCVVYGSIWAREKTTSGQTAFVDMQGSRFTVICRDTPGGVEMCSIHHSMPYLDQGTDEYYPKTLSLLARELEEKSKLDRMTELFNRYHMEQRVTEVMSRSSGYFFTIDIDDFKKINDTMGHLAGDKVIKEFAGILRQSFSKSAIIGRMGGDEFAVWDAEIESKKEAENYFAKLLSGCEDLTDKIKVRVTGSAGIVFCREGQDNFADIYQLVDKALYHAKARGKAMLVWADEN